MTFILKAGLMTQGRRIIIKTNIFKEELFSLNNRCTKQLYKPLTQARLYSSEEKNVSTETRERLYTGILHKKIRMIKTFSLLTSATSILCQPYLISKAIEKGGQVGVASIILVFGFFAFATPVLLHLITKRYVAFVDYNPVKDTYIATTYTIFIQKKEVEFKPEDVELPNISEMLTTCFVKGIPMFIDVKYFKDIEHYKRIMGFDKPLDFSINAEDVRSRKN